ncbi:MAG: prolyl oligopeptidase family serine peptidase [Clostridiales bacterium]|nr:prolyl oligopeptidase family serine peptidase [Clostridiales bacterium]
MKKQQVLKRFTALLLVFSMLLALAACGSSQTTEEDASAEASSAAESSEDAVTVAEDMTAQGGDESTEAEDEVEPEVDPAGSYSLVQNVYNWGSSYSKAILLVETEESDEPDAAQYTVSVWRYDVDGALLDHGDRTVTAAYRSDAEGNEDAEGAYVTLEMEVASTLSIAAPYYTNTSSFVGQLKDWATCSYTITDTSSGEVWNQLDTVYHPDEKAFQTGTFTDTGADYEYSYAYYEPEEDGDTHPLVIWLHGAGSGGTDIGFVTGGMLVTNFVSEETQEIFGGAHILLPQCPTVWMDDGTDEFAELYNSEEGYSTNGVDIYTESLMALIEDYVATHDDVDTSRIYLAGCSNGGYMTIQLAMAYPDTFAAIAPVCAAYDSEWISDEQIETLASIPTWFVHCSTDPVVDPTTTSDAIYARMVESGAENIHYTTYDEIVDPDYGTAYIGHFAWVYALKNLCSTDLDGSPVTIDGQEVTIFEWLAAQSK